MKNYTPFGDEWKAEVMKWNKATLVNSLREAFIKNKKLEHDIKYVLDKSFPLEQRVIEKIENEYKQLRDDLRDSLATKKNSDFDEMMNRVNADLRRSKMELIKIVSSFSQ